MEQDRVDAVLEFFIFQGHFEGFSFNCRLAISGFWVLDSGLGVLFASLGGNASSLYLRRKNGESQSCGFYRVGQDVMGIHLYADRWAIPVNRLLDARPQPQMYL